MNTVPLTFLSDSTTPSGIVFNHALEKSGKLIVPRLAKQIVPSGPSGISGIDLKDRKLRKGSPFGIGDWLKSTGGRIERRTWLISQQFLRKGGFVWIVADEKSDLGVIWLSMTALKTTENHFG